MLNFFDVLAPSLVVEHCCSVASFMCSPQFFIMYSPGIAAKSQCLSLSSLNFLVSPPVPSTLVNERVSCWDHRDCDGVVFLVDVA